MTAAEVRKLRAELQAKLDAIGPELGFRLTVCSATFLDTVTFKMEAAPRRADGTAEDEATASFRRFAHLHGLKPEDLGREFVAYGTAFRVCGLAPRSYTYPILGRRQNGAILKFRADIVRSGFSSRPPRDVLADLRRLDNEMSPENLYRDGEVARPMKRLTLMRRRAELVRELGREPTAVELEES